MISGSKLFKMEKEHVTNPKSNSHSQIWTDIHKNFKTETKQFDNHPVHFTNFANKNILFEKTGFLTFFWKKIK